ncbi:hypothetical protein C6P40_004895 [Pichia californica]|uniref:aspartyl aminopeptidase n=1 Tax=Pichia californica TaxID=460514 RepID=A0A9P6WM23_9ASCO|nr:hypothetical protein C6P40_004895 [[Candida] californica]
MSNSALQQAQGFIDFVNQSPTPYHVVNTAKKLLKSNGFQELSERSNWAGSIKKNSKYFVTRNSSSLIAFTVGGEYQPGNGFAMIGGHTDSPVLRIKPISKQTKEGYHQIGVEPYGGGIWHTWFDRDLSIAGRVFVNYPETGKCIAKLVKIDRPLLRIPTLAIHLTKDRYVKFEFNKETQFKPIAGLVKSDVTEKQKQEENEAVDGCCKGEKLTEEEFQSVKSTIERHNKELLDLIAEQLSIKPTQIEDFELVLFDTQPSCIGGLSNEFIFSPRLDNQVTCYSAIEALINSSSNGRLDSCTGINLISLFDHEEIGSLSAQGADSSFLPNIVERLTRLTANPDVDLKSELPSSYFLTTMAKSFMISSDMAHGVNPNYAENYESYNKPMLNEGPVLKINANQRYVTNSAGIVLLKKIGNLSKVPLQLFVIRNDSPCGSTIGPMISAKLGVRTLDLGNPQLSMHSIRETCGSADIEKLVCLFESYFENYNTLEDSISVDGIDSENDVLAAPALFASYNLVPGLKSSLSHNEQLPFTESEVNSLLKETLKKCLNDHYIFVKIPGLQVSDFQNFTVWHHFRSRLAQGSTIVSMPNIISDKGIETQEEFGKVGNIGFHSVIDWDNLQNTILYNCEADLYNVQNMEEDEVPNFMDIHTKLITIDVPEALLYFDEIEDRQHFLSKVDELIRKICMKFPSPKVGVILASTTTNPANQRYLLNRGDVIEYENIPNDPKVLTKPLLEKIRTSKRYIFPDITIFDKSRYYEYERNEIGERHRLSDLKDKQWAKDGDKNIVDMEEDDTWLEKKEKVIVKDENLYKYGEDETFRSVFDNKQFIRENALWIVGGVWIVILFVVWDFIKLLINAIISIANRKTPVQTRPDEKEKVKKEDKTD